MQFIDLIKNVLLQFIFILLCGLGLVSTIALASDFNACNQQFLQQRSPQITNDALSRNNYPLCFNGFAVQYSGVSRTPLWSAEYLTPQRIKQAKTLKRQDNFHEESKIPVNYRATLNDYKRSGYDRGHMAPNGDMATLAQQQDSFSLANMVPQSPHNNQEVWRNLEEATRSLVTRSQQGAYVVTGPAFLSNSLKQVGKVLVPSHVYKAVYFPDLNVASAYFAPNDESGDIEIISIAELEQKIGVNVFPALKQSLKTKKVDLPLTAQQANQLLKSSGLPTSSTSKPDKSHTSTHHQSNEHATSWMDYLKHHLVELLVSMVRGK